MTNKGMGPIAHIFGTRLAGVGRSQTVTNFLAKFTKEDLVVLQELLEAGEVKSVIDRTYELSQIPDALRYLGEGHARGKVVINA